MANVFVILYRTPRIKFMIGKSFRSALLLIWFFNPSSVSLEQLPMNFLMLLSGSRDQWENDQPENLTT